MTRIVARAEDMQYTVTMVWDGRGPSPPRGFDCPHWPRAWIYSSQELIRADPSANRYAAEWCRSTPRLDHDADWFAAARHQSSTPY